MKNFCVVLAITTAVCLAATQDYTTVPHNSPAAGYLTPQSAIEAMSPPPPVEVNQPETVGAQVPYALLRASNKDGKAKGAEKTWSPTEKLHINNFYALLALTTAVCLAVTQDYTTVPHNSPAAGHLPPQFAIEAMSPPPPEMLTLPLGMLPPPFVSLTYIFENLPLPPEMLPLPPKMLTFPVAIFYLPSEKWALLLEMLLLPPVSTHPAFEVNRPETVGAQVPYVLLSKLKKYGKVKGAGAEKTWSPAKQQVASPQQAHAQKQMHTTNHQGRKHHR